MKVLGKLTWWLFFFMIFNSQASAETLYVTDQLVITLRTGKSSKHEILKTLKTGTPLEVLERAEGDAYVKVKVNNSLEGYVLEQYLTSKTPKSIIISRFEREVEKLKKQLANSDSRRTELAKELNTIQDNFSERENEIRSDNSELNDALEKSNEDLQDITQKYNSLVDKSAKVVEITSDRDRLQKNNSQLASEVQALRAENSKLMRTGVIKWFLAGGGVFLFGWMIGKISRKRKSRL